MTLAFAGVIGEAYVHAKYSISSVAHRESHKQWGKSRSVKCYL